ncbi:MAG: MoxR family ATPase [Verrucomicrobia bacterium]|nr:MoxR family ATPase [Verrucomicrobiota bacterium]
MSSEVLKEKVAQAARHLGLVREEVQKVIVGQHHLIDRMLVALVARGHVLLEGLPGLAKTLAINCLGRSTKCSFSRVQFTPDLLPADVTGTLIFDPVRGTYSTRMGPVFANLLLADEINRASAKVQSALLEAMQEHQVTIGEKSYKLPQPFFVLATQNPIEQEGTYPLPEAQVDRFMMKVIVPYPTEEEEKMILERMASTRPNLDLAARVSPEEILEMQEMVNDIYVDEQVKNYVIKIVFATRTTNGLDPELKQFIRVGASPRATINLTLTARAAALLQGRTHVTPDDVKAVAHDVLRHRILLTYEAEAEEVTTDQIVEKVLSKVPVP